MRMARGGLGDGEQVQEPRKGERGSNEVGRISGQATLESPDESERERDDGGDKR